MEIKETIGIDVSKLTIDVTIHSTQAYSKFENEPKGFKSMLKWVSKIQPSLPNKCFMYLNLQAYTLIN